MNSVIMTGRLTRDPEIRYTQGNGLAVASYPLAVNRKFKRDGEPDADFFNCVCFGKNAEFVEEYLTKGIKINIRGSIQNENYTNKEGQKVYLTKIVVEEQEFAESKSSGNDGGYQQSTRPEPSSAAGDGFMNIPDGIDEELPFN
jgi:single-strand DNA-binding protein